MSDLALFDLPALSDSSTDAGTPAVDYRQAELVRRRELWPLYLAAMPAYELHGRPPVSNWVPFDEWRNK